MCPPDIAAKQEEVEDVLSSLSGSSTPRGAKAKHELPEPPAPSKSVPRKSQPKVDDDDDVLTSLCGLFDGMWPVLFDDDSDTSSESNSQPPSPRSRSVNLPSKTYFLCGENQYYYDQDHNVFLQVGQSWKQIHLGRAFLGLDNILDLEFIDGLPIPYFFGVDGALYCTFQDLTYLVPTETYFGVSQPSDFVASDPSPDVFQSNSGLGFEDISPYPVSNGDYCGNPSIINPNPLNVSLQGQPLTWSPGSSSRFSPIVTGSRASSSEPLEPLIPGGSTIWSAGIDSWKEETKAIQEERNYKPASKLERRRCRHCNKVFRRPSSLEDHLNVHSGAKPHICPFERCNTGFATKSNMKRHFQTHRVGTLEEYCRRGKLGAGNARTATYNAKAFHTQRFRLVSA